MKMLWIDETSPEVILSDLIPKHFLPDVLS